MVLDARKRRPATFREAPWYYRLRILTGGNLLQQRQLLRSNIIAGMKRVEIDTARETGCIKCDLMTPHRHKSIHKSRNFLAEEIVDFQRRKSTGRNLVLDRCGRVEWVRVVLAERIFVRQRAGRILPNSCIDPLLFLCGEPVQISDCKLVGTRGLQSCTRVSKVFRQWPDRRIEHIARTIEPCPIHRSRGDLCNVRIQRIHLI